MSYLMKVIVIFCMSVAFSSCQATDDSFDLSAAESDVLDRIFVKHNLTEISPEEDEGQVLLTAEVCEDIVKEIPSVALKLIKCNQRAIQEFGYPLSSNDESEKKGLLLRLNY